MGKILCRYIYRELATPFFFALLIFTIILFTVRILKLVELVVNRGVPLEQLLAIFLYILPAFFEVTVPMSLLLALLWSFGRLSSDREIVALKSCGISFLQMAVPVAVATLLVLCGTFFLTLYARPWSNAALRGVIYEVTKTRATAGLKEKTFNDEFAGVVVYTDEIHPPGTLLQGVMIADNRSAQKQNTIFARQGLVVVNEDNQLLTLRLFDGTVHSTEVSRKGYQTTHFSTYDLTLNLAAALTEMTQATAAPQELSLRTLQFVINEKQQNGERVNAELSEWHRRFSLPFSCVVFALLALPLAIRPAWGFRSHGFAISIAIIVAYYVLLTVGETLGKKGSLPPALALWLPNLVLGTVGIMLFLRTAQEKR
ncbi:MAG: LPS export ABC transporter permease LptF [Deltaproteobacteria bacterium]|nr:LPS export ABC transporter permease LptF [Deltaproteobacteria bacterium]